MELSVRSRSYFVTDGRLRLVGEGSWYWHPGEAAVKGVFAAIDMPVAFHEHTTRVEHNAIVHDLRAYDTVGEPTDYRETRELTSLSECAWTVLRPWPDGHERVIGGTYVRRR
jgi:hypothetical protein